MKSDYLDKQSDILRRVSAVAMGFAFLFFVAGFAVVIAMPFFRTPTRWSAYALLVVVAALFAAGTGLVFVRLYRNRPDANRVTLLPAWFIQAFGVLGAISLAVGAYMSGSWWLCLEGIVLFVAMLTVGRAIEKRQQEGAGAGK